MTLVRFAAFAIASAACLAFAQTEPTAAPEDPNAPQAPKKKPAIVVAIPGQSPESVVAPITAPAPAPVAERKWTSPPAGGEGGVSAPVSAPISAPIVVAIPPATATIPPATAVIPPAAPVAPAPVIATPAPAASVPSALPQASAGPAVSAPPKIEYRNPVANPPSAPPQIAPIVIAPPVLPAPVVAAPVAAPPVVAAPVVAAPVVAAPAAPPRPAPPAPSKKAENETISGTFVMEPEAPPKTAAKSEPAKQEAAPTAAPTPSPVADPPKPEAAKVADAKPAEPPAPEEPPEPAQPRTGLVTMFRLNPLGFGVYGALAGQQFPWVMDWFAMGLGGKHLEFVFALAQRSPFPARNDVGGLWGTFTAYYRPIRAVYNQRIDFSFYGGGGAGGFGNYAQIDSACVDGTLKCGNRFDRWLGVAHVGVEIDVNFHLKTLARGQGVYAFVGLDVRPQAFINASAGHPLDFVVQASIPFGVRFD